MKRYLLPTLFAAFLALPTTACEVQDDGTTDTSNPPNDTSTTTDTTVPTDTTPVATKYYAVFLDDLWDERCATSSVGAHGADIDAVGLFAPGTGSDPDLVGYLDVLDAEADPSGIDCGGAGGGKAHGYSDTDEAKGPPDGELTKNFYSLYGGWLIGEFENGAEILDGYSIVVYEIDDAFCGGISSCVGTEPYEAYIATELDCVNTGSDFRNTCMIRLTGTDGAAGEATIPVSF